MLFIDRIRHSGAYRISGDRRGVHRERVYYGYTRAEAIAQFRSDFPCR